ncbi:uncharacterized protein LOC143361786 [Halictus rubicundus]|uniref:uncharacterized protein LOC143361786 n=1 Tax=Halictus rubicundus TaxID=77578 RepID=UPI0040372BA5
MYTLAYADDVAKVAEDEEGMRGMMRGLEKYLEERKLQLNAEKSKVLEEVTEFKYLGYVIMRDGGQRKQVEDRIRKGAAVMGQVWRIGKRRFGNDWGRRIWLFDKLVWSVVSYGAEIWGVDRCTPGYVVREVLQRELLRGRAG